MGDTFASFRTSGSFPVSKDFWKSTTGWGKALRAMSVEQWVLIHRGPQPYLGSSRGVACQCLRLRCLYQAFWGRDWAGRGGQHLSHEVNMSFPLSKDFWKSTTGWEKALRAMSVEQWVLIHRGPQPYLGSSRGVACQCLRLRCLYQAFWGRDWAGRGGQHRSHEVNTGESRQFIDKTTHRHGFWRQFIDTTEDSSSTLFEDNSSTHLFEYNLQS